MTFTDFFLVNKNTQVANAGFENKSILSIANFVKKNIPSKIKIFNDKNDPRSYRLRLIKLYIGYKPKKTIHDAILEIRENILQVS